MSDERTPVEIAVLDYGIGNLRSAQKALEHVGATATLTADPTAIQAADGVVLPGVGAFGACMGALRTAGLDREAIAAVDRGQPFLGICVGMQMLFEGSDESPGVEGLGLLTGKVRWLPETVKRPQMQWNQLRCDALDPLLEGLDGSWVYFVHSLSPEAIDEEIIATAEYGGPVTAAVRSKPVGEGALLWATQFHPEKSADAGLRLLTNFVAICRQNREVVR